MKMRNKRIIFYNSILSLAFSWGISYYLNRPDQEAVYLMAVALTMLCMIILIPAALGRLDPGKSPLSQGAALVLMLLPLLAVLSHPVISISSFMLFVRQPNAADYLTWLVNFTINGLLFFGAGYGLNSWSSGTVKPGWGKRILFTLLILIFYTLLLYAHSY